MYIFAPGVPPGVSKKDNDAACISVVVDDAGPTSAIARPVVAKSTPSRNIVKYIKELAAFEAILIFTTSNTLSVTELVVAVTPRLRNTWVAALFTCFTDGL